MGRGPRGLLSAGVSGVLAAGSGVTMGSARVGASGRAPAPSWVGRGLESFPGRVRAPRGNATGVERPGAGSLTLPSCPTGLEDRPSSGSWGTGEQNSSSFDPSRVRSPWRPETLGWGWVSARRTPAWPAGALGSVARSHPDPEVSLSLPHPCPSPLQTYGDGAHFSESHGTLASSTFLGPGLGGECPRGPCPHPRAHSVLEHRGFRDGHPEQRTQVGTSQVPAGKWTPESRQPGEAESEAGPLACSPQSTGILTMRISIGTWVRVPSLAPVSRPAGMGILSAFCVASGKDSPGSLGPKAHPHLADEQTEAQREGTRPLGPSGPGWVSERWPC